MNVAEQTIDEFMSAVASGSVAPAGGTAAAVVGALGASLCEMVCVHTIEGEYSVKNVERWDVESELSDLRDQLLALGSADAELVDDIFASGRGVDDADGKRAVGVPLATAEVCRDVLDLATVVVEHGAPTAVADARTGALLGHAALRSSLFTVRPDTEMVTDESFLADVDRRVATIDTSVDASLQQVTGGTDGIG